MLQIAVKPRQNLNLPITKRVTLKYKNQSILHLIDRVGYLMPSIEYDVKIKAIRKLSQTAHHENIVIHSRDAIATENFFYPTRTKQITLPKFIAANLSYLKLKSPPYRYRAPSKHKKLLDSST